MWVFQLFNDEIQIVPAVVSEETRVEGQRYGGNVYLLDQRILLERKVFRVSYRQYEN